MTSILLTRQSVVVPATITLTMEQSMLMFEGPLGKISLDLKQHDQLGECFFSVKPFKDGQHILSFSTTKKRGKPFLNAFKALLVQYFKGLTQGFLTSLECVGIGYKVQRQENVLHLRLGLSHVSEFVVPDDIQVFLPKPHIICFFGIDKKKVHKVASDLQHLKLPDAYKGKGLRFTHLPVSLKEGKKK